MIKVFDVILYDFDREVCGVCAVKRIADAMAITKCMGYAVDVVDMDTGEVLYSRVGNEVTYSIF